MTTFRCEFLGCKVNQYDAERARRHLLERGFEEDERDARLLLLAGCTVTSLAGSKSRRTVRRFLRERPDGRVAVLGCVSEEDRRWYRDLGAAVTFLASAREEQFLPALEPLVEELVGPRPIPTPSPRPRPRRTRAHLKVEDGCDLRCAYCIIPSIRGRARSRDPAVVEAEFERLLEEGTREVVVTGVHLGHYGRRATDDLPALLRRLASRPGDHRIRVSSLEVSEVRPELLEVLRHPRIVPHLHLPLQSGSESVLRRMRRPYTVDRFRSVVRDVRRRLDAPSLTTDLIVGFPGETEAEFTESLRFCEEIGFAKIHVFPFSAREGTAAAERTDPVPAAQIEERKQLALVRSREGRERSMAARIGEMSCVLIERATETWGEGVDERWFRVRVPGRWQAGDWARCRVIGGEDEVLLGEATHAAGPVSSRSATGAAR